MNRVPSRLLAVVLMAFALGVPLFLLGWHAYDALERRATLQSPVRPATVLDKRTVWAGRGRGTVHYAKVQPVGTGAPAEVEVSDAEYESLQRGQQVAVSTHPSTHRQLLTTAPWWTWKHVWWIVVGALAGGYFLKLALAELRPQQQAPK